MPDIEFLLHPHWSGVAPEPEPAAKYLPSWYRELEMEFMSVNADGAPMPDRTLRRCMPFLDAMQMGYVLRLPSRVYVQATDNTVQFSWGSIRWGLVDKHDDRQFEGSNWGDFGIFKWVQPWFVKTPPGYSVAFLPLLNRHPYDALYYPGAQSDSGEISKTALFECLAGVVETDTYPAMVNFPFRWLRPNWSGWINQGEPLVQVFPFRREDWGMSIGEATQDDLKADYMVSVGAQATENYYKGQFRRRKSWNRRSPEGSDQGSDV